MSLLVSLMMVTLLSALSLSLALACMTEARVSGSYAAGVEMLYAADAGLERALGELLAVPDWNRVLDGTVVSGVTDGLPGVRLLPDGSYLDLRTIRVTENGPWGANNPAWQLYASAPLAAMLPIDADSPRAYVIVWTGDDSGETDGAPLVDSNNVILLVAHAYGAGGARRAIEVAIERAMAPESEEGGPIGIRVLAWREIQ